MPVPDFSGLPPFADFNDVTTKINDLVQRLRQLLLTLDTLNIRSLHAKVIEAGTITADKLTVEELSAISANLGHITAGLIESVEIYGSYIATRKDEYPRSEMSDTNDLFGAYLTALESIEIEADYGGVPSIKINKDGQVKARISTLLGTLLIDAIGQAEINVTNNGNLLLPAFNRIFGGGLNLGTEINKRAVAGVSTRPSGSHNHGIPDGTVLRTADGGTVTFYSAASHTHEQSN